MQTPLDIGADVSKDYVIVACAKQSLPTCKLANKRSALLAWLKGLPVASRIGMEATGTYHELLAILALRLGLVVYVLNAKDVHHYAKATGQRGKTDRVDTALIARYVAKEHSHLHPWHPASPAQRQLQRLVRRRAKLTSARATLRSSLQTLPSLRSELRALLKHFDVLLTKLDAQARKLIDICQERAQHFRRLNTIPSVGNTVGIGLLAALERWPLPRADAFVAFVGLDPRPDDSGQKNWPTSTVQTRRPGTAPLALCGGHVGLTHPRVETAVPACLSQRALTRRGLGHTCQAHRTNRLVDLHSQIQL